MLKNFFCPQIDTVQLDSLHKHSPTVVLGNFFLGIANVAIFWQQLDQQWLSIWSLVLFLIMVFRVILAILYKCTDKALISNGSWHRWFVISSLVQGLCWCALGMYAVFSLEVNQLTILFISISGLIGGSIATTSSSVQAFVSFAAPALFPIALMMVYSEQSTAQVLGLLAVIYFTLTVRAAFDINSVIRDSIDNRKELESAKKKAEILAAELYTLSTQDALTLVANRRGFDETLEKEWKRASRKNIGLSLLMLDIDYFKKFNDFYGHLKGDEALRKVAYILKQQAARSGDFVARYGGEEFAVILPDSSYEQALALAQKICKVIMDEAIEHPASQVSNVLTVSMGVAHLSFDDRHSQQDLVKQADEALYKAKGMGRNCAVAGY
jgi:diguanylate cyclase (GGDEF)-like protein